MFLIWRSLLVLAVTVAALIAVVRFVRRPGGGIGAGPLRLLAYLPLGPRRGLAVVRVASRTLLLGLHEHGLEDLGPVPDWPDSSPELVATSHPAAPALPAWLARWARAGGPIGRGR